MHFKGSFEEQPPTVQVRKFRSPSGVQVWAAAHMAPLQASSFKGEVWWGRKKKQTLEKYSRLLIGPAFSEALSHSVDFAAWKLRHKPRGSQVL